MNSIKCNTLLFRNITGNPLACDCNLLWLIPWSSNMSVKLQPPPKCETPSAFRGLLVKKLKVGQDLHCDTPLQPLLELKPDQDQVHYFDENLLNANNLTHFSKMLLV